MARKIKKKIGNQYVLSHAKFLRKGDEFRTYFLDGTYVDLTAMSDPYFDIRSGDYVVDIENPEFDDISA